ncbi:hypothetical protein EMCG_07128 [[Emmonsia] crescens]|uniref:Uncharacterized protein n=1 Tax=[Emmonsia] crescens TaxID=73230 RepID=A0A0G2I9H0_9EURO|nr:hypothetical protein EMCG_07128 [Emmonsia crescens UAMH 3008]
MEEGTGGSLADLLMADGAASLWKPSPVCNAQGSSAIDHDYDGEDGDNGGAYMFSDNEEKQSGDDDSKKTVK